MAENFSRTITVIKDSEGTAFSAALIIVLITLFISFIIHNSQSEFLNRAIKVSADNIETTILNKTYTIISSIDRMAARWEHESGSSETSWRADAQNYIAKLNGIVALMHINEKGVIQWVEGKEPYLLPKEYSDTTKDLEIMGKVPLNKMDRSFEISPVTKLHTDSYAIHLLLPIWIDKQFRGYIAARFNTQTLLTDMVDNGERTGFVLEAYANDIQVYQGPGEYDKNGSVETFNINLDADENQWSYKVFPTKEVFALYQTRLPFIITIFGSLIALFLYITMVSRVKSKKLNNKLIKEKDKRRKIESKLNHMSQHDALTHLPNRNYLNIYLENKIKENHMSDLKIAVMSLNLDDFKQINDTYGHQIADEVLKVIPNRINKVLNSNSLIAHMGGDEFVICITEKLIDQKIFIYAEDLLKSIRKPFTFKKQTIRITASLGVSYFPEHAKTVELLLTKAEYAMKEGKNLGKDIYTIYDENIETSSILKSTMIKSFNQAIDDNEFEMFFQPRHNIKTGEMVSSEALIRWNRGGKIITPDKFLDAAEESGMIVNICNSAFNLAFSQYQQLFNGSPSVMLSINVSAKQLSHADFLNDLFAMLDRHQFPSKMLEIELTEQTLIESYDSSLATLNALNSAGIKIALDDFGTGYSSLSYLKNFPVDVLKIDRSFIMDIHKNLDDLELTKAIIAMGKSLNMEVVAEGVENRKQLQILADEDCHQAQGYFLNKPMNFKDFTELFEYQMHQFDTATK